MVFSFTYYNGISKPEFVGLDNYIYLFTQDSDFMRVIIPNTLLFALIVGPGGYVLSFALAWILSSGKGRTEGISTGSEAYQDTLVLQKFLR